MSAPLVPLLLAFVAGAAVGVMVMALVYQRAARRIATLLTVAATTDMPANDARAIQRAAGLPVTRRERKTPWPRN